MANPETRTIRPGDIAPSGFTVFREDEPHPLDQADQLYVPLQLSGGAITAGRREYGVTFIKAGRVRRRDGSLSNWLISEEAVKSAVELLSGVACFLDHAPWFSHPSLRDAAGVTFGATYNEKAKAAEGGLRLYNRSDLVWLRELLDQVVSDQAEGREVLDVGLSLVFFAESVWEGPEDDPIRVTKKITYIESCDLVFGPGAEGRVREILSKARQRPGHNTQEVVMPEEMATTVEQPAQAALAPAGQADLEGRLARLEGVIGNVMSGVERLAVAIEARESRRVIEDMGVGVAPRDRQPGQLRGGWLNSLDQVQMAYEQLMGLPVSGQVHRLSGIRELYLLLTGDRNFRGEFNRDLVPDFLAYSSSGATADTTTMAELTRNVMAKVLIQNIELLTEYRWWERVSRIDEMNSLQQVSWVRYGGIGYSSGTGLPTVAEKGEYQQLLWEDERTTGTWVKKGGYLPLSLEMIDRDDLEGWRSVPRQLAVAQAVTISSVISALFTDNAGAGADLADSVGDGYAFNTTRGNLITQALDQTNWWLAVDTMYKLAELRNSSQTESRRIAARPRFVLVPIELEGQAITSVTSAVKPGTFGDRAPTKRILSEEAVITVPHWTNANNWAALADPMIAPFIGVAFRFGRVPEIFMPDPNNHILWLHDVLPIKTRWFFAVGVIDTRGAIKSNQG